MHRKWTSKADESRNEVLKEKVLKKHSKMPIIRGKKSVPQATKRREDEMFEKIKMASATFTVQPPSVSINSSDDSDDDEEMRQNSLKVFLFNLQLLFQKTNS